VYLSKAAMRLYIKTPSTQSPYHPFVAVDDPVKIESFKVSNYCDPRSENRHPDLRSENLKVWFAS
jgi:hypothetical protein